MTGPLDSELFASCGTVRPPVQVGGKWDAQIIFCLLGGARRFSEIQVPMRHVAPKVLTESLRTMERDGFVSRTVHSESPRHVTYALTTLGYTLTQPLQAACEWSQKHLPEVIEARRQHEAGLA